jgi:hypothetical protein
MCFSREHISNDKTFFLLRFAKDKTVFLLCFVLSCFVLFPSLSSYFILLCFIKNKIIIKTGVFPREHISKSKTVCIC